VRSSKLKLYIRLKNKQVHKLVVKLKRKLICKAKKTSDNNFIKLPGFKLYFFYLLILCYCRMLLCRIRVDVVKFGIAPRKTQGNRSCDESIWTLRETHVNIIIAFCAMFAQYLACYRGNYRSLERLIRAHRGVIRYAARYLAWFMWFEFRVRGGSPH